MYSIFKRRGLRDLEAHLHTSSEAHWETTSSRICHKVGTSLQPLFSLWPVSLVASKLQVIAMNSANRQRSPLISLLSSMLGPSLTMWSTITISQKRWTGFVWALPRVTSIHFPPLTCLKACLALISICALLFTPLGEKRKTMGKWCPRFLLIASCDCIFELGDAYRNVHFHFGVRTDGIARYTWLLWMAHFFPVHTTSGIPSALDWSAKRGSVVSLDSALLWLCFFGVRMFNKVNNRILWSITLAIAIQAARALDFTRGQRIIETP